MKQGNFVARICNFKQRGQDGFLEEFQEVSVAKAEQETVGEEAVENHECSLGPVRCLVDIKVARQAIGHTGPESERKRLGMET